MLRITSHVQNFSCKMCGTCCQGNWKIALDPEKIDTYKKLAETDRFMAEHFSYNIGKNEQAFLHDCKLMLSDHRCYLHAVYGASSLSSVCLSYPRYFLQTDLALEAGLSYACHAAAELLGTGISILNLKESAYTAPLPKHTKELHLNNSYYRFEEQILADLAENKFSPHIFSLLQQRLPSRIVNYSSFAILSDDFSLKQFDFIALSSASVQHQLSGNNRKLTLEQLNSVLPTLNALLDKNAAVITDYFTNFFFTKSFYPYRELEEDMLLMAQYVFCLFRYHLASLLFIGASPCRKIILEVIRQTEREFMHNNFHATQILTYLSEWY